MCPSPYFNLLHAHTYPIPRAKNAIVQATKITSSKVVSPCLKATGASWHYVAPDVFESNN